MMMPNMLISKLMTTKMTLIKFLNVETTEILYNKENVLPAYH